MSPPTVKPCGTYAAARRHQRRGEPLCAACVAALAEHQHRMYLRRRPSKPAPQPAP